MAKRSAKRRQNVRKGVLNVQEFQRDEARQRNLQVLEGGWRPTETATAISVSSKTSAPNPKARPRSWKRLTRMR